MDPSATWVDLAEAVRAEDWEQAEEHARNLLDWLAKGGFPPIITGTAQFDRIAAKRTCEAIIEWNVD